MAYKTLDYLITASWSGKQATTAASSDIAGVGKAAGVADPQVGQFSLSLGKLAVAAGGFVAAGVLSRGAGMVLELGRASLLAASDFEESYAKFNTVFGEAAGMAEGNLQEIADATGRSTAGLIDFAATLQDTFVPLGFARTEAAALSTELVGLALDLASFNNLDTDTVVRDLQSALVGNTETLRKYGVVANETTIKQYALSEGLWDGVGALDAQTKAQAILGITLASTTDAQGDAARTADGFANSTRGLQDAVLEAQIALGQRLLPTASDLTQVLSQELVPAVADLTLAFVDSAVASDALQGNLVQTVESLADSTRYAADNYSTLRELVGVLQAISQPVLVAGDSWGEFTKSIVAGNDALDEFRRSRDWGEKLQMAQGWIFDAAEGWVSFSLEVIHADGVLQTFTASLNEMRYAVGLLAGEFGSSGGGAKQGFVKGVADAVVAVEDLGAAFGWSLQPMLDAANVGTAEMALIFERLDIAAERGLTSVSGPLVGMIGQLREARAEVGSFFSQISAGAAIDPAGLLMDTAAAAGASARNLYEMAGATDEALQALVDATIAAKAEELGNAVAAGAMTGVEALAELERFAQNLNLNPTELLEPTVLSTETAASVIKANTLALVEGVSEGATTASRTATTAVDELRTRTEELVTMPKPLDFEPNDAAVRSVLDDIELWATELRGPWPIEFSVTTTGAPPAGAGGSSGAPPPPASSGGTTNSGGGGGAPGGSGPAGRGPATNNTTNYTTNNYWTNGVTPGTLDNALASYGRRSAGATR